MNIKKKEFNKASFALLGNTSTLIFSFLNFLLIIRIFPQETFGIWVLFLVLNSMAEMSRMGFVYHGVVKFITESKNEYSSIFTTGLIFNTIISLLLYLLLLVLSQPLSDLWHNQEIIELIKLYGIFFLTFGSMKYLEHILVANGDFKGIFLVNTLYGALNLAQFLILFLTEKIDQLTTIIWIQSFSALMAILFALYLRNQYFKLGKVSWVWISKLFTYGKYVFGTNLSSMILQKMDLIMIGYFMNPMAVAAYHVAAKISNYIEMPMKGISQIIFPKIVSGYLKEGKSNVGKIYEKSIGLLLALIVPPSIIIFILAKPVLLLVGGPEYISSVPILQILLIYSIIKPWGRVFGLSLDAIGKPDINFYFLLFGLAVNLFLNVLLIPKFGIAGAAIATLASISFTTIIGQLFMSRIVTISLWEPFRLMLGFYKYGIKKLSLRF